MYNIERQNALLHSYSPRVAIVTGATHGIGYAIAHKLAEDGINIAINDVPAKADSIDRVVAEICAKGRRALAVPGDVSQEADVKWMIEETVSDLGSLDIMVANAEIAENVSFLETTVESLDRHYDINVKGAFLCYKYAAQQMIKQRRGGRIIGASTVAGKEALQNSSGYVASKFGMRGVTQNAALELRKYGITVNCYAPASMGSANNKQKPTFEKLTATSTSGLDHQPDCIASMVAYIAKPESYLITAQTISVDGGISPS